MQVFQRVHGCRQCAPGRVDHHHGVIARSKRPGPVIPTCCLEEHWTYRMRLWHRCSFHQGPSSLGPLVKSSSENQAVGQGSPQIRTSRPHERDNQSQHVRRREVWRNLVSGKREGFWTWRPDGQKTPRPSRRNAEGLLPKDLGGPAVWIMVSISLQSTRATIFVHAKILRLKDSTMSRFFEFWKWVGVRLASQCSTGIEMPFLRRAGP